MEICWPSKPNALGALPWCQTPSWGAWHRAQDSLLWENACDRISLLSMDCPLRACGIWLYCECTSPIILLWFLLYIHECRISFVVGSGLFTDGCSVASCVFGVVMRGGVSKVLLLCHLFASWGFTVGWNLKLCSAFNWGFRLYLEVEQGCRLGSVVERGLQFYPSIGRG